MADTENTLYEVVNRFFHCYLTERNAEKTLSLLSKTFISVGTGDHEVATSKEEFRQLLEDELQALPSPIAYEISDFACMEPVPNVWQCFCYINAALPPSEHMTGDCHMRVTASIHKTQEGYLIDVFHASVSNSNQSEGEYFPIRFIAEEMNRLNRETQRNLIEIVTQVVPGGVMGGYNEPGFPLYVVNKRLLEMTGHTYQSFLAETDGLILNTIHPEDRENVLEQMAQAFAHGNQYEIEYRMLTHGGGYIWVYDVGRKSISGDGREVIISVLIDITQRVSDEETLRNESKRDSLTGLYNRKGATELVLRNVGHKGRYLYLMADLDHFKQVNDIYGHDCGDMVLQFFAEQLREQFRKNDVLCRIGGDEFIIYLPECDSQQSVVEKLTVISQNYCNMIQKLYPKSNSTVSFGGVYGDVLDRPEALYRAADQVLYKVKHSRKGQIMIEPIQGMERG